MNVRLIKKLDAVIGYISASTFPPPVCSELSSPINSLLIIRPGGIGDAILLVPAILALKDKYPVARITVLAEKRNGAIFSLCPAVNEILYYDRAGELLSAIRGMYDAVVDTEQWHRLSAVVARLVQAPVKIGFDTNERRRMFTHPIPYSHDDYEEGSFAHLLEPLGIEAGAVEVVAPFLSVPDAASGKAAGILESLHDEPYVVIFPGASIPARRWGAERFNAVARGLADNGYRIVVVGGREVRAMGELIAGAGGLNLAGRTTLAETAAVIIRSKLVISGDSGVLHVAVGLDIPTVSLFGPGIATKWAPQGDKHVVLNRHLSCSPCTRFGTTPPCPHGARCMNEITVDHVVEAALSLLQKM